MASHWFIPCEVGLQCASICLKCGIFGLAIAAHQAQECLNAIKHKDEVVMGFLNDVSLSLSKLQGLCKEFGAKMVFDHLNRLRNIGMGVVAKGATAGTLATTIGANIANLTTESASLASAPGKICGLSVASAGGSIAKGISSSLALIGIAAGIWDIVEGTKDINGGEHVHAYRVAMAQVTIDTDNIMFAIRGLLHSMNVSFAISGVVQSGHNGFGLDVAGASTRGGAKVLTWPIHCGLNQLWDHWHEGYLMAKMTGLVLDARSMTMQPLQEGDKHQMWIKGPNNTLRNKASDKVLDICGESKEKGAQLCVWEAHGGTNQEWAMEEEVFIKSCKDGKVLDIAGASQAEGAEVIAYDQHFGYNQQWRRTNDLLLVSKMHSMCLEVEGGEAKPGQPVRMRKVTHADKQMFRYRDGYLISLLSKDLVLEISKEGRLVLGKKTGSLSQKWKLL